MRINKQNKKKLEKELKRMPKEKNRKVYIKKIVDQHETIRKL